MEQIVAEARMLAHQTEFSAIELTELYKEGDGGRIAALAVMQAQPAALHLPLILDAVENSRSAFEQYHALLAINALVPKLTADQLDQVVEVIEDERSGGSGKHITPNSDRWFLADRILDTIANSRLCTEGRNYLQDADH
jgi:hypothetical protein